MQSYSAAFTSTLTAARDGSIAPVYFLWVVAKNRATGAAETFGLWSGDEDIAVNVQTPEGGSATRQYYGGVNLSADAVRYVANMTDVPINVSFSQIAPATQQLVRGYDVRLAYCEVHATTWVGGVFASPPQLQWVGVVDDVQIGTPEAGGNGQMALSIRSQIMAQLTAINPAKSSDAHQKRRQAGDRFSEYAGVIKSRDIQWYRE